MKKPLVIGINVEWALRVGKDEFLNSLTLAYPDHDLHAEWDKISPPKKEAIEESVKPSKK